MTVANAIEKEGALTRWLLACGRVAIGFSGGVDSSYLAAITMVTIGAERSLALIGRSASLAGSEEDHAAGVARALGMPIIEIDTGELSDPRYAANPTNRCYFCKSVLWMTLIPVARERGFETLVDGTNADDLHDYRPGGRAATEQGVRTPLADVGLTKAEIRALARRRGFEWWDRPAAPCLASRLPYGTPVTPERLRQVDTAEAALRALGVTGNLRVRHHGVTARIELDRGGGVLARFAAGADHEALIAAVKAAGFETVELDARGFRSGSLNVLHGDAASPTHGAPLPGR